MKHVFAWWPMLAVGLLGGCLTRSETRINESTIRVHMVGGTTDSARIPLMYRCAALTLEFVDQFESAEGTMYEWFENRRGVPGAAKGGTVILSLTVLPSGRVSDSRIVSSTVGDPVFVDGLRRMVAQFPFFREEVVTTRVGWFPIVFTPLRE